MKAKSEEQKQILYDQFDHVIDSHHGIYSGQLFAQTFNQLFENGKVKGISKESWQSLLNGPDDEFYLDSWADLDNIEITSDRVKYLVYQNEGIFLYPKRINNLIDWDEMF
jgi:hypothetical protein